MKPSIGRIVFYKLSPHYSEENRVRPATIMRVHNDTCVDLCVTLDPFVDSDVASSTHHSVRSVVMGDGLCQWSWPPRV